MSAVLALLESAAPTFPRSSRYRLGRAIAVGPNGASYVAFQRGASGFERIVVVEPAPEHPRDGLFGELARTAGFRHANVVGIDDVEEHEGVLYLVSEYVEGTSLASLVDLAAGRRLPPAIALRVALDVRTALEAIHDASFIARRVSLADVLVGSDGVARLTHFGLPEAPGKRGRRAVPSAAADRAAFSAMLEEIGTSKKALGSASADSIASHEDVADFVEQVACDSLAEQRSEIRTNAFAADDTFEEVSQIRTRTFALPPEPAAPPELEAEVPKAIAASSMKADLAKLALALFLVAALCLTTAFACGAFFRR